MPFNTPNRLILPNVLEMKSHLVITASSLRFGFGTGRVGVSSGCGCGCGCGGVGVSFLVFLVFWFWFFFAWDAASNMFLIVSAVSPVRVREKTFLMRTPLSNFNLRLLSLLDI